MVAAEFYNEPDPELIERRLLTEVSHLIDGMRADGSIDEAVLGGVLENNFTKMQEDTMPGAVTTVVQPIAEVVEENGKRRRTFIWKGLGRSALSVAESGFDYYFSEAGYRQGHIEVNEALRSEQKLTPGIAQSTIGPRWTLKDAPIEIAKQEHMADDDSIRVAKAVVDGDGNIIGRMIQSLLVRDIPLNAWVAMLKDSKNIFGKAFEITNEESALSVLGLFDQLDLPEAALPEGPVTLVAAVLPYITDPAATNSIKAQLVEFRSDQRRLEAEAKASAAELTEFEAELARSLKKEQATFEIKRFIIGLQNEWDSATLAIINNHWLDTCEFKMTQTLAAMLEQAKQKLIGRGTKILIGSADALKELGSAKATAIQREIQELRLMKSLEYSAEEIASRQASLQRTIAHVNIETGGGCNGTNKFKFGNSNDFDDNGLQILLELELDQLNANTENQNSESRTGKEKLGVCRIDGCPTGRKITKVGGCDVCLKFCQPIFDRGDDPQLIYIVHTEDQKSDDVRQKSIIEIAETIIRAADQSSELNLNKLKVLQNAS